MATSHGGKLAGVGMDEIRDRLAARPSDGRVVARLVAALEYKSGLSPAQIQEKYGWPEGTVYHWLDYLEERGIDGGLTVRHRSGRPPKLNEQERARLEAVLAGTPEGVGVDRATWSPRLVQDFIEAEFGVEYSRRHVRRLMDDLGTP